MEIIEKVILPIGIGISSFLLSTKVNDWKERKKYSKLGIATLKSLKEEIDNGIKIFYDNPFNSPCAYSLPRASWFGMQTIKDDVLLRIIEINRNPNPDLFPFDEINIHLKNYFEHMTTTWDGIACKEAGWEKLHENIITDFKDASLKLSKTLEEIIKLLDANSRRIFPR